MLVAIGDLHLTDSLKKGGLSAYIKYPDKYVAKLVQQPLAYARARGIQNIVLLGDLFESPRGSYEGQKALLSILRQDFKFHIILGNHDCFAEDPIAGHSLELIQEYDLPNVSIYTEPTKVKIQKASFNFLPWPHQDLDPSCMNLAHVDVNGAKTDSGRLIDNDKLSSSKAHAVIGHIHTAHQVRNTHFIGTLYQTNFGESSEKFFAHISFDGDWQVDYVPVAPYYKLYSVEVSSKESIKPLPASPRALIKLILLPNCNVTASDYAHLNVVKVSAVSNQKELEAARVEDIGTEVKISTDEFFKEWLRNQTVEKELKKHAYHLRKELLK